MTPTRAPKPSPIAAVEVVAGGVEAAVSVRVGPMTHIPRVLRELGFDPAAVLAGAGFAPSCFGDPDLPLPYAAAVRLLGRCASATGCEHFGLLVGARAGPECLGLTGLLLVSASDVATALDDLVRHLDLRDRGAIVSLQVDHGVAWLSYTIVLPEAEGAAVVNDLSMTVGRNLMRSLCGPEWRPTEVMLPRRRPTRTEPWTRCFRVPVQFDADRCALAFDARWLERPLAAANLLVHSHLEKEAAVAHTRQGGGLVDEVRRAVRGMVSNPPCTAPRVASLLGMHERTLNRRLHASGTTFMQQRDEVLYAMSRQLLDATSMPLTEIGLVLGYADAAAFTRAFVRWSGQAPGQWRRQRAGSRAHPPRLTRERSTSR